MAEDKTQWRQPNEISHARLRIDEKIITEPIPIRPGANNVLYNYNDEGTPIEDAGAALDDLFGKLNQIYDADNGYLNGDEFFRKIDGFGYTSKSSKTATNPVLQLKDDADDRPMVRIGAGAYLNVEEKAKLTTKELSFKTDDNKTNYALKSPSHQLFVGVTEGAPSEAELNGLRPVNGDIYIQYTV